MEPLQVLPFQFFIGRSTGPMPGKPRAEDKRTESANTVTVVCRRFLYNYHTPTLYKGTVTPDICDILVQGSIEVDENCTYHDSLQVFYTGPPTNGPALEPGQIPYATVVTIVVTFIKPSAYHTTFLDEIPLDDVRPMPLEKRGVAEQESQSPQETAEPASSGQPAPARPTSFLDWFRKWFQFLSP
ncbi:hypothetical protein CVT24_003781 [Panaeolus cyanescens]|uniref:Uncharacterized protein n=1 Tax=Panaeolus cyanescens TaxID=181874 RepID=A0A409VUS0_9AGAR|nr:hypothetical protein CVT24_003781 [Panaeolus cyanescens]